MDELKAQREKMAKWNDQRTKSEETGLKDYCRMKEAFTEQSKISCNPVLSDEVCRCTTPLIYSALSTRCKRCGGKCNE